MKRLRKGMFLWSKVRRAATHTIGRHGKSPVVSLAATLLVGGIAGCLEYFSPEDFEVLKSWLIGVASFFCIVSVVLIEIKRNNRSIARRRRQRPAFLQSKL